MRCHAQLHFDAATNGLLLLGAHTVKFMCVKHLAEFFGTEEHVLRAKIEELKDNNCPLFR